VISGHQISPNKLGRFSIGYILDGWEWVDLLRPFLDVHLSILIHVKFSLNFTPTHSNTYRLRSTYEHPNKFLAGWVRFVLIENMLDGMGSGFF
jgi:hypothetical protein